MLTSDGFWACSAARSSPAGSVTAVLCVCTGVDLSAMTVSAISYLSETMPAAHRGRAQSTTLAVGLAGIPAIAFLARDVVPLGADGWRIAFLVGGLGLLAVHALARLPESPRWLLYTGRTAQARAVLTKLGDPHLTLDENAGIRRDTSVGALAALAGRRLRRRTAVMLATWMLAMLGFYAFAAWVPAPLAEHCLSLAKSLTFSAITTIVAVPRRAGGPGRLRPVLPQVDDGGDLVVIAVFGIAYGFQLGRGREQSVRPAGVSARPSWR
ncbi:MFS transporter [Amycolatopsis sp. FDAARGOS 1241]|uniref:MFS transporter n=1 Tax=Amycolatopsis sp. FDAARGOS 1241 TaxID=2778070 RepID=UPI001EF24A1B|nr:MFS transporter [Amycolatopsis sp. FDAARGOS 1241]